MKYIVEINWDDDAHKWVVSSPNVKGLAGEASTIKEALVGEAPTLIGCLKPTNLLELRRAPYAK